MEVFSVFLTSLYSSVNFNRYCFHYITLNMQSRDEKRTGERTPAVCSRCSFAFCAPYVDVACPGLILVGPLCPKPFSHRYPSSHSCPTPEKSPQKNSAAQALLAKHFPASATGSKSTLPSTVKTRPRTTDPVKLAQIRKVELMKMKLKATPGDPHVKDVPIPERLHVRVKEEDAGVEKVFWFRKVR